MQPNKIGQGVIAVALLSSIWASPAWAQDPIHKAGRGVVNVLTSVLEIPRNLHLGAQEENPLLGLGVGLVKGVVLAVVRIGVGVYEVVTFPIPYPSGYASPYEGLELPDYPWE